MSTLPFAGFGRKRPLFNVDVDRLHLDPQNPRLPENSWGKQEEGILRTLYEKYDLNDLVISLSQNGYFDEEPLVAVPKGLPKKFAKKVMDDLHSDNSYMDFLKDRNTEFTVMEGNRRLATIKLLLSHSLRSKFGIAEWPIVSSKIKDDLEKLPVIIYPKKEDVLPYMGTRHITGIKKWEPFAKARYIDDLFNKGYTLEKITNQIGEKKNEIAKYYISIQLLKKIESETELPTDMAKSSFSLLVLAIGQLSIKDYLGMARKINEINLKKPVPDKKIEELSNLFSWLFGEGTKVPAVIAESRDITNKLPKVLADKNAIAYLISTRNLDGAYERCGGERESIVKWLTKANAILDQVLGIIHRQEKSPKIKTQVEQLVKTVDEISKRAK